MSEQDALEINQQLLAECQELLMAVSHCRYANSLLTKVKSMLLACLGYKANRVKR